MRTSGCRYYNIRPESSVGMKPLSERDENLIFFLETSITEDSVGMKPLSERDENQTAVLLLNISRNL